MRCVARRLARFVVRCSLFVDCCLLFVVCCSLLSVCCSLVLSVDRRSLRVVRCVLIGACSLFAVC